MNILICGDSLNGFSGLSSMSSNLLKKLYDEGHNISYFGLSNRPIDRENYTFYGEEYKNCFYNSKLFDHTTTNFDSVCKEVAPNIVISIHDMWNLVFIYSSEYRHTFKWINWCLFETSHYPEYIMGFAKDNSPRLHLGKLFRNVDLNIPVTKMGSKALKDLNCKNILEDNIYIGIDFDLVCKKNQSKREVFGKSFKEDDFVFMNVNKNLDRKRIDLVLQAFDLFLKKVKEPNKEKFKLYIHTDLNIRSGGTDLITQVLEMGLQKHFYGPLCFSDGTYMSKEELYKRYKACDCYISLPGGEGFGLGFLEALAHNKPVVYSDYGGHVEFCKKYGKPVWIKDYIPAFGFYSKWAIADVEDAAKQMIWIYEGRSKEHLKAYNELKKEFDWKIILDKFYNVLIKYYEKNKNKFNLKRIV